MTCMTSAEYREYAKSGTLPRRIREAQVEQADNMERKLLQASGVQKTKKRVTEHDEQSALIRWARLNECRYPKLKKLYAVPNGGYRCAKTAADLKAEGVRKGIPDLHLPVARGGYHGLWIEMKVHPNVTTPDQDIVIEELREEGHRVEVCWSMEEARDVLLDYLKETQNTPNTLTLP